MARAQRFLTLRGEVRCDHGLGRVTLTTSQDWVVVKMSERRRSTPLLRRNDTVKKSLSPPCKPPPPLSDGKPCTTTLSQSAGWSPMVFIDGVAACLESTRGLTDSSDPNTNYRVRRPGQGLVWEVDE